MGDADSLLQELQKEPRVLRILRPAEPSKEAPARNLLLSSEEDLLLLAIQGDDWKKVTESARAHSCYSS